MIRELDPDPRETLSGYDLCIIGSGPAGTTLACELADAGLAICILESGRLVPTPLADRLRATESEGVFIKEWSRERVLGGASTTWSGLSSPFDKIDFEPRSWLPAPWPFERDELIPWYRAASKRYRFPELEAFGAGGFTRLRKKGDLLPNWSALEEKVFLAADPPQRFGHEQRETLEARELDVWLDASVLALEAEPRTRRIARAVVRSASGRERRVEARAFVLAAGGLENARLLLLSTDLCADGLGNDRDQVGRYLMNHPKNYFGQLEFARPVRTAPYFFGCLWEGFAGYAGLRLPETTQREDGLLNSYVRLEPLFPWTDSTGVEALVTIAKKSKRLLALVTRRKTGEVVELRDYSETGDDSEMQNARRTGTGWWSLGWIVLKDLPRVLRYLYYRMTSAQPLIHAARVRNFMEMEPDRENRVLLGAARDPHGQRIARAVHSPTDRDKRTLAAVHAALARDVEATGLGRLVTPLTADREPWPIDQDASHHMGTTRMGADPATSVVDPDCKLHGADNVWVAGASVFPTGGCANPTFTLVALAIRLAAHLRTALQPNGGKGE